MRNKVRYVVVSEPAVGCSDSYNNLCVGCRYTMIEDKLELSRYMPWTFVSCHMGMNTNLKPSVDFIIADHLR